MKADFHGKTAVIVGADPAGQAAALALAREGAAVYACGEYFGELETLAWKEGLSIHTEKLSLTDDPALASFITAAGAQTGAIHVLVCNGQGPVIHKPVTDVEPQEWSRALDQTLRVDWKAVSTALPWLEKAKGAVVFLTSAAQSHLTGDNGVAAVCAAGTESMIKTLASEVASRQIRVNGVALGAEAGEAAGAVLFLASEDASYCTGTTLEAGTMEEQEAGA